MGNSATPLKPEEGESNQLQGSSKFDAPALTLCAEIWAGNRHRTAELLFPDTIPKTH